MGLFGKADGCGIFGGCNDLLVLILVVLLFNSNDGLFNEETLAVIIILWLICEGRGFGIAD